MMKPSLVKGTFLLLIFLGMVATHVRTTPLPDKNKPGIIGNWDFLLRTVDTSGFTLEFSPDGSYKQSLDHEKVGRYLLKDNRLITYLWDTKENREKERIFDLMLDGDHLVMKELNGAAEIHMTRICKADPAHHELLGEWFSTNYPGAIPVVALETPVRFPTFIEFTKDKKLFFRSPSLKSTQGQYEFSSGVLVLKLPGETPLQSKPHLTSDQLDIRIAKQGTFPFRRVTNSDCTTLNQLNTEPRAATSPSAPRASAEAPRWAQSPVNTGPLPPSATGAMFQLAEKVSAMSDADFAGMRTRAEKGEPEAETILCAAYYRGEHVPLDYPQAFEWCRKAAQQNFLAAEEALGQFYMMGRGTERNGPEAVRWLSKAASEGSLAAAGNLGTLYVEGRSVPPHYAEAMKWYRYAADRGDARSMAELAIMYLKGEGVGVDSKEALRWLRKAADVNYAYAALLLGMVYQQGTGDVHRDLKESLQWLRRAAELGSVNAQSELGWIYANGIGTRVDHAEAVRWYGKAAAQGDPAAQYGLGVRYLMGQGVARDAGEAEKWLVKAAAQGHADAQYNLALLYLNYLPGGDRAPDRQLGAKYAKQAAEQGVADAQFLIGMLYAEGTGVTQDHIAAYQWLLLARENRSVQATSALEKLEKEMTPDQIALARQHAEEWHRQHSPKN